MMRESYQKLHDLAIFSTVFKKLLSKAIEQRKLSNASNPPMVWLNAEATPPQKPSNIVGTSHSEEQWPKTWISSSNFLEEEPLEEKEDVV